MAAPNTRAPGCSDRIWPQLLMGVAGRWRHYYVRSCQLKLIRSWVKVENEVCTECSAGTDKGVGGCFLLGKQGQGYQDGGVRNAEHQRYTQGITSPFCDGCTGSSSLGWSKLIINTCIIAHSWGRWPVIRSFESNVDGYTE